MSKIKYLIATVNIILTLSFCPHAIAEKGELSFSFSDCDGCPEMVFIPGGEYLMGSDDSDETKPVHKVLINRFLIGKTEVTKQQWKLFVSETHYTSDSNCMSFENGRYSIRGRNWINPGHHQSDSHPVVCISWNDAQAYIAWLSKRTRKNYRMPTESEWEYVARSMSSSDRHWGKSPDLACTYENVLDKAGKSLQGVTWEYHNCSDGYEQTSPVGRYLPNNFGVYDILGNVSEWVEDTDHDNYDGAPNDGSAWTQGHSSWRRMKRGGSWFHKPERATAYYRARDIGPIDHVGFRVARFLTDKEIKKIRANEDNRSKR